MTTSLNRAMQRIVKGDPRRQLLLLLLLCAGTLLAANWARAQEAMRELAGKTEESFQFFAFMTSPHYATYERVALWCVLAVAFAGLGYALMLIGQVKNADTGTEKMQKVADAVRAGANAYLREQFKKIVILIGVLTILLFLTAMAGDAPPSEKYAIAFGRAFAFLMGSLFSFAVGFVGMRFATLGNLRVAAAARDSFGRALQIGYRTGTITGMLTDGLGLLGGTLIFMAYGEKAYEVLLGFGFGATLIALFMRVGGGIYTKAADVGADLVGKIEAGIPEDDPRNAATIADNVGDNVGDCAGMAADIFESYEVTIVAAMILGWASFGHKGVIFPLLVRAIGVVASIISTYSVRAGDKGSVAGAMKSVNRGFAIGSTLSIIGFVVLGLFYLRFDASYFTQYPQAAAGYPLLNGAVHTAGLPFWANLGFAGLDMRPAWTCLVGILLAIGLNRCTEYWTGTEYTPVKSLAQSCQTGHATNIIQGFAVGYESTVWAILIIAVAILASVGLYTGTSPVFVAYGVAMCGIGMLTLTGNTISMDVFGPVADNANGIGEMGYEPEKMGAEKTKIARQILADLDAVGNTTKAVTKGIAIGSAVIAAVSLFNSYISTIAGGSEAAQVTREMYDKIAGLLTVANPSVFIGFLIGGAIPFLFSSMTIRAVGRAAFLIVKECRTQFRDREIWEGRKLPDYGRVVGICTATAQKELIGPGLLAILAPVTVGFLLGPLALAGFLAGMILVGQLLAVFMANAGGAWDNAKKTIEDGLYGGKRSEAHKASVTGDTVGDPLKDTAGPAINPLIKVMNMVSLLVLPLVLMFHPISGLAAERRLSGFVVYPLIVVCIGAIVWAVRRSKEDSPEMKAMAAELDKA